MERPERSRERPPDVTASAMILIVLGVLGLFANTVVLVNTDRVSALSEDATFSPTVVIAASLVGLVVSCLEVVAGSLVLRLSNAWRIVGIVIGVLGAAIAVMNSVSIGFSIGPVLIAAANAYVVVTLVRLRGAFSR